MNRIVALAYITFLNGLRRNAVWGLCVFSLLFELFGILFMDFFGHDLGRVISDFQFTIMFAAGMIFILFYAIQAIAWDEDHRSIDSILARPISRAEYVLGTMAGLSLLLLCFEILLGGLAAAELLWAKSLVGDAYFPVFSALHFTMAWGGLQLILLAHLAVAMLVSSAIRGAFPVMLITLAYSLICSGLPVVRASLSPAHGGNASDQGMIAVLQGLGMIFPDFGALDLKDAVLSHEGIEAFIGMQAWLPFTLMGSYTLLVLLLACIIYQRRDIL
ncbi:MAG: hypothetical protein COW19_06695 [Zetaproteobacteria bacterium CG12_big_fil_rev_8_21_14_0_65_55_1124]|nr:MAG: hypothetical protein AUJ58_05365 [Zetaproteobacteria bacterium CG1_02_55_237]PIS20170.1 MAG: hypothetical protein COT53_01935 [Zetaproteobacteria bacterium CG08_land_8_20_14_0_20_55_17]PIW42708.1 MAG: hypothetical protein COW19_06695 [Zetaproteobacteria bacterium CG12_big_fil_rev_8_21_14_0_65_55_1124]PIY53722.1 MAG: hypothetical protein COZ01_02820 [Zetaproteobacteria bacterium CG_4_10_14_0_8_um_filter_55_43]PIZ38817.1 MAG: hypothetical protein COY36_04995 [Zetaproteobacteria bacterium 